MICRIFTLHFDVRPHLSVLSYCSHRHNNTIESDIILKYLSVATTTSWFHFFSYILGYVYPSSSHRL